MLVNTLEWNYQSSILLIYLQFGSGSVGQLISAPCNVNSILKAVKGCVEGLKLSEGSLTS